MRSRKYISNKSGALPEQPVWVDIAFGLAAGLVATQITNLAQKPLSWVTPDHVDRHEKKVRPGASSSLVASQKITETLNLSPSKGEQEVLGQAIHFATGISWGPVYGLLRRYGRLKPVNAALVTGGSMSLILDEALVPALGLSAPNNHYPAFTRIRGLAAHLVFGAAVAVVAEGLARIVERRTR
ncbi:hypothetical protein C0214_20225 [Methylobacterium sp. DM1]|nr:hypothetical protein C0214_20225 [Methylobacterium sp. DM1]